MLGRQSEVVVMRFVLSCDSREKCVTSTPVFHDIL